MWHSSFHPVDNNEYGLDLCPDVCGHLRPETYCSCGGDMYGFPITLHDGSHLVCSHAPYIPSCPPSGELASDGILLACGHKNGSSSSSDTLCRLWHKPPYIFVAPWHTGQGFPLIRQAENCRSMVVGSWCGRDLP